MLVKVGASAVRPGVKDRLNIQATMVFDPSSPSISGNGLWRLNAYGSTNVQGTGAKFQHVDQLLSPTQQAQPLTISDSGFAYVDFDVDAEMDIAAIGCGNYRFLCFDFTKGVRPSSDFPFTSPQADTSKFTVCQERACSDQGWLIYKYFNILFIALFLDIFAYRACYV